MKDQNRMAARMAQLRLQGDEAPARFALIGAIALFALATLFVKESNLWPLGVGAIVGAVLGWVFGLSRRAAYRRREQHVESMLDRVERNSPEKEL